MNRTYKDFINWVRIIINTLISVSTAVTINYLAKKYGLDDFTNGQYLTILIFSLVPIVVVSRALIKVAEFLLAKSVSFRRFVMGKFFIEGYWLECTFEKNQENDIVSFAVLKFSIHHMDIVVSGDAYDNSFNYVGNFRSSITSYKHFNLKYAYAGNHNTSQPFDVTGHGKFVFSETGNFPIRFTGYFQDTEAFKDVIYIRGEKITDLDILDRIEETDVRIKLMKYYSDRKSVEGFNKNSLYENS